MSKMILLLTLFGVFFNVSAHAQDKGLGAGVIIGDPTGIGIKVWTNSSNALQFAVAWQARDQFLGTRVRFGGEYLWHSFDAIRSNQRFPVYYGIGGELLSGGSVDPTVGIDGVLGIDWLSSETPFDVFMQISPLLMLTPSTNIELEAGIGMRYFFR